MISTLTLFRSRFLCLCMMPVLALTLQSCSGNARPEESAAVPPSGSVTFTHKTEVNYAKGFRISYHSDYKLLEILNPFQDKTDTLRYILKPRGTELRIKPEDAQVIDLPVHSMIVTSTTHIGLAGMLDAGPVIKGIAGADYVYDKKLRQKLREGEIISFSQGGLNKEQILALDPDLIMISAGSSARFGEYRVLMKAGIDVIANAEWLETTPLGKAEWVKVMAALLNKEALANERFGKVAARYEQLKAMVDDVEDRPLVINNMPYKGSWFVPGGDSFTAQYLKDAGAAYPWFDRSTSGGLRLSFEAVYVAGLRADVWLNPRAVRTKEEILAKDPRFKAFKAFKTGRIYNSNKRKYPSGGNDFWESGVVHPDIVLADLIRIFHPSVLSEHELYYYRKVNGKADE